MFPDGQSLHAGQRLAACSGTAAEFRLPSRWHPSPIGIPGAPAGILFCQEPVPLPEAGDHRLPQRQTAVVGRHHAVREHAKTPVPQEPVTGGQQKPVLEGAAAERAAVRWDFAP